MKLFKGPLFFSFIAFLCVALWGFFSGGLAKALEGIFFAALLSLLEISLSFDNAVVNAVVLQKMSEKWQKRFLTWGILIAVFGMRLLFPILIVSFTARLSLAALVSMIFSNPALYAQHLAATHSIIGSFGGMFLLMVFFNYFLNEAKEVHWLKGIERQLKKLAKFESIQVLLALLMMLIILQFVPEQERYNDLVSGLAGIMLYVALSFFSVMIQASEKKALEKAVVSGSLALFLYLELLDASFSFDGVIVAFAITRDIVFITAGLGIGAMFVRSLTILLVRRETLKDYIFLEQGAHWAIGSLAVLMLLSLIFAIPELLTGLLGAGVVIISWIASVRVKN